MIKARFGRDIDRHVLRVLPIVARIRVHPDFLTLAGVGFSAVAAILFSQAMWVAGGWVMGLGGLCDLFDGVVARAQLSGSRAGAFFDSSLDRVSDVLVMGGIAVGFAARAELAALVLTLWALGGSVITSYVRARAEVELGSFNIGWMERGERYLVLLVGLATGYLVPALVVVALGSTVTSVHRIVVARRKIARLDRLEIATGAP